MTLKRPTAATRNAASLLVLSLSFSACGFTLSQGPPAGYQHMDKFRCTESELGPTLDAAWAILNLLTVVAVAQDNSGGYDRFSRGSIIGIDLGGAVLWGSSAAVGFHKSKKCIRAKQQLRDRQALPPRSVGALL